MKKSHALKILIGAAAMYSLVDPLEMTEQGSVSKSKARQLPKPQQKLNFNQQEGVKNLIKDYKLITQGKSNKGLVKQARIKSKINQWLTEGKLTKKDLT